MTFREKLGRVHHEALNTAVKKRMDELVSQSDARALTGSAKRIRKDFDHEGFDMSDINEYLQRLIRL